MLVHVFISSLFLKLLPDVTEQKLKKAFDRSGDIINISIRSVSGNVCAARPGDSVSARQSSLYASIQFKSSFSAGRALRLHGLILDGARLHASLNIRYCTQCSDELCMQVTQNVLELPEMKSLQDTDEKNKRSQTPLTAALQANWLALK